jgi:hypothetical protein
MMTVQNRHEHNVYGGGMVRNKNIVPVLVQCFPRLFNEFVAETHTIEYDYAEKPDEDIGILEMLFLNGEKQDGYCKKDDKEKSEEDKPPTPDIVQNPGHQI